MPQSKKSKKNIAQEKEKQEAKKSKKKDDYLTRSTEKSKNTNTEDPYARKYKPRRRNLSNPDPHILSAHQTRAQKACLKRGDSTPNFHGFDSKVG